MVFCASRCLRYGPRSNCAASIFKRVLTRAKCVFGGRNVVEWKKELRVARGRRRVGGQSRLGNCRSMPAPLRPPPEPLSVGDLLDLPVISKLAADDKFTFS